MQIKMNTSLNLKEYFIQLGNILSGIEASDYYGKKINLIKAADKLIKEISSKRNKDNKIIIIGNGGSASMASHIAVDLWKNGRVKAISFSDSALLTCVSNDFGYQHVFEKPIEMFAKRRDLLIAISSSGKSENILKGVSAARKKRCAIVTLSGFNPGNALRKKGDLNFYVPSNSYGYVEIAHSAFCHFIIDKVIIANSNG